MHTHHHSMKPMPDLLAKGLKTYSLWACALGFVMYSPAVVYLALGSWIGYGWMRRIH